jgi:small conductance mechanosensitive channel
MWGRSRGRKRSSRRPCDSVAPVDTFAGVKVVTEILDPFVIVGLFVLAWLVARASASVARRLLTWHDGRHPEPDLELGDRIARLKWRETSVSVIRGGIAYAAFAAATVLSAAQLIGGVDRLTALAGASFVLILLGFAIQRVLADLVAGLAMFVERWYAVGDTIVIPTLELQGVVEDLSLRRTKLRTLAGEIIHVHNAQIPAVRVLPRGAKHHAVEFFARNRAEAETLVETVASLLPSGPTTFVRRPHVADTHDLGEELVRVTVRASVAPGREWLAESFFPELLKDKAAPGLIVHGPVTLAVDERASKSFARASASTRRGFRTAA